MPEQHPGSTVGPQRAPLRTHLVCASVRDTPTTPNTPSAMSKDRRPDRPLNARVAASNRASSTRGLRRLVRTLRDGLRCHWRMHSFNSALMFLVNTVACEAPRSERNDRQRAPCVHRRRSSPQPVGNAVVGANAVEGSTFELGIDCDRPCAGRPVTAISGSVRPTTPRVGRPRTQTSPPTPAAAAPPRPAPPGRRRCRGRRRRGCPAGRTPVPAATPGRPERSAPAPAPAGSAAPSCPRPTR